MARKEQGSIEELKAIMAKLSPADIKAMELDKKIAKLEEEEKKKQHDDANRPLTQYEIATGFVADHPEIRYGQREFKRYALGSWESLDDLQMNRMVLHFMEKSDRPISISDGLKRGVVNLVRDETAVKDDVWNSREVLVFGNCTFDLAEMKPREHRMDDFCTRRYKFDYDQNTSCPCWHKYLKSRYDKDVQQLLQEYAGYSLIRSNKFQVSLWLVGDPGCGKSTFLNTIGDVFGDLAIKKALIDLESSRFAIWNIPGKTLLIASETGEKFTAGTQLYNELVDGSRVTIEPKGINPREERSTVKMMWGMNVLPIIPHGRKNGIFRRVLVVRVPPLQEEDRDENLMADLEKEHAGIMAWAIEGLKRLLKRGHFEIPQSVRDEMKRYQAANDIISAFVEESLVMDAKCRISASQLYDEYRWWCGRNGHVPSSSTRMSQEWVGLGLIKKKEDDGNYYLGARLLNEKPDTPTQ